MEGWPTDNALLKSFNVESVPTVLLVDKFSIVDYIGHPEDTNLSERINKLIN